MVPVRAAGSADLPALIDCVRTAFEPYVAAIGTPPAALRADYGAWIGQGRVFVLDMAGALAGLVVLERQGDELVVDVLAVRPEFRRIGIGRRLMTFVESEARRLGAPMIGLAAHQAMADALAFYAALGYQEVERPPTPGAEDVHLGKPAAEVEAP